MPDDTSTAPSSTPTDSTPPSSTASDSTASDSTPTDSTPTDSTANDGTAPTGASTGADSTGGPEEFDLVVLGVGSGGEVVASEAAGRGMRVAAVEANLLGGECPFLACIPSKVLLLAASRARSEGTDLAAAWREALARRDEAVQHLDDSDQHEELTGAGVTVVRGRGEVTAPGVLRVSGADGDRQLRWTTALVVGTGSSPVVPDLPGLDQAPTWTSDQALTSPDLPGRLLVLGGGPVGCELSQVYASFGVTVTLVETSPHLLSSEDDWVGDALAEHLGASGVDVRTGTTLVEVSAVDGGTRATLRPADAEDGDESGDDHVDVDRVLVVTGRTPSGADLGLERLGVKVEKGAVTVDDACRVLDADGGPVDGVFAVGDVTAVAPYTHTANAQARVVASRLAGRDARVRTAGIPRAVYTEPPVFAVGLGEAAAREAGHDVLVASQEVAGTARAFVETVHEPGGTDVLGTTGLRLVADTDGRLLGAAAVGPHADSWGGELALAVTAGLDVALLAGHVRAFPSWSEAITPAALELAGRCATPVPRIDPVS